MKFRKITLTRPSNRLRRNLIFLLEIFYIVALECFNYELSRKMYGKLDNAGYSSLYEILESVCYFQKLTLWQTAFLTGFDVTQSSMGVVF